MATTRVDSGNIQLRQQGGVPMRQIEPRSVQYIAGKVEAEYSQVMGQMLDRMSAGLIDYAGKLRSKEGLKWAAENQITDQQLEDMKGGKSVDIGGGAIIINGKVEKSLASIIPSKFNEAVLSYRSDQLAFKFEQQGISEMSKMLEGINRGDANSSAKNIIEKLNVITKENYEILTGVDPAAANRYNATMATYGNTVYKTALKAESEYNQRLQGTRFYEVLDKRMELNKNALKSSPKELQAIIEAGRVQVKKSAETERIGLAETNKVLEEYDQKTRDFKLDAIKQELRKEDYLKDPSKTRAAILSGNVGNLSEIAKEFLSDSKAIEDISKDFSLYVSYRRQDRDDAAAQQKIVDHKILNDGLIEFHNPKTTRKRKQEITIDLASRNVLSPELLEKMLKPEQINSNPYFVSQIEFEIESGTRKLTIPELNKIASRLNFSSADYSRISNAMSKVISKEESDVKQELNAFAGFGNNVGMISRDDSYKVIKRSKLNEYYNQSKNNFIDKNPGKPIPFNDLKNQALEKYKSIDENDRTKQNATKQINNILEDYKSDKIKESDRLPKSLVINEDTSISDLKLRYPKIKSDDIKDLIRLQKKLRGEN